MSDEHIPNTSVVEGNIVDDPIAMIASLEWDLERKDNENEFWYSFTRELVMTLVQRRGTLAARRYVEHACEIARRDFPADSVATAAVTILLDEPRRLSLLYSAWGSFKARDEGLARGEQDDCG